MTTLADGRAGILAFAGLTFRGLTFADIVPSEGTLKLVVTVNADFVVTSVRSARFRRIISENYATFDGQVTWWLAKLFGRPYGTRFDRISGASVLHDFLGFARTHSLRVFFLGGTPQVNQSAVETARKTYGVDVVGCSPPFAQYPAPDSWRAAVIHRIVTEKPKLLFVALGSPKQEFWLDDHLEVLKSAGVLLAMGCGGALDFLAGALPRAPRWVQMTGVEGLYRLAVQPSWMRLRRLGRSLFIVPIAFWYGFCASRRNTRSK